MCRSFFFLRQSSALKLSPHVLRRSFLYRIMPSLYFLSLSLGIGAGGVFSYYKVKAGDDPSKIVYRVLFALGISLCIFITATIGLSITSPFVFLLLVFLPFFSSGVVYAQIYKAYSTSSFRLYASDLSGAAVGSIASLGLIGIFGAPNSIIFIALVMLHRVSVFLAPAGQLRASESPCIRFSSSLFRSCSSTVGMSSWDGSDRQFSRKGLLLRLSGRGNEDPQSSIAAGASTEDQTWCSTAIRTWCSSSSWMVRRVLRCTASTETFRKRNHILQEVVAPSHATPFPSCV